jgi:cytochrome c6
MASTCFVFSLFFALGCQQQPKEAQKPAETAQKPVQKADTPPAARPVAQPQQVAQTAAAEKSGEALFKEYCAMCHANGGNIINPEKTLSKKDRQANNVDSIKGIVHNIRNPGPGMARYDEETVSNDDAKLIAEYILKTFN